MAKSSKKPPSPGEGHPQGDPVQFIMENMIEGLEEGLRPRDIGAMNHTPHVDIYSTKTELVVEVDLPGVKPDEIDISLFRSTINITAVKYECLDESRVNYVCMERSFGKLSRTVEIPVPVNSSKAKATYDKGILTIHMPRVEEKRGKAKKVSVTKKEE